MDLEAILKRSVDQDVSDIFIVPGAPVTLKMKGDMTQLSDERVMPADTEEMLRQIYRMAQSRDMRRLLETGDDDFSFSLKGVGRFRCNAFKQRGSLAAVLRVVVFGLPDPALLLSRRGYRAVQGASGHGAGDGACRQRKVHDAGVHHRPD